MILYLNNINIMQLTGKQIVEKEIITNWCSDGLQQQGVDVRLESVKKVEADIIEGETEEEYLIKPGEIPTKGKTKLPKYTEVKPFTYEVEEDGIMVEKEKFYLSPGYYEVTYLEGCKIPNYAVLNFKTRSSLVRCGAIVHSGQFDAGFETDQMGSFLEVLVPITIERFARIAQAVVTETYEVDDENMYDGQWQNDKQRMS